MFTTLVVVGAALGSGCGPAVADDESGDGASSEASSNGTTGPGTSAGTSTGSSGATTTASTSGSTGPGTTTVGDVTGDDASDGSCPTIGCKLDLGIVPDLPPPGAPYECCYGETCDLGLMCDAQWSQCTTQCISELDCPPAPGGNAEPLCYDNQVCVLDCSDGQACPDGFDCMPWFPMLSVCTQPCVVPIA